MKDIVILDGARTAIGTFGGALASTAPIDGLMASQIEVIGTAIARTKFGALVAAVARRLVPNCSLAVVTKIAQYPVAAPTSAIIR